MILFAIALSYGFISIGFPFSSKIILLSANSKSIAPLPILLLFKILHNSSIALKSSTKSLYLSINSLSLSLKILVTSVYVILSLVLITLSCIEWLTTFPLLSISIKQVKASLSTCGFNEHIPFDNFLGSIGITLSTK